MESSTVSCLFLVNAPMRWLQLHLLKTYCLPTLIYSCEVCMVITDNSLHKVNVAWNNCFRRIFSCCWRESTRPLQFFCNILPISFLLDQRRLIFGTECTVQIIQYCISCLDCTRTDSLLGCKYCIDVLTNRPSYVYVRALCGESLLELWLCKTFYFYFMYLWPAI